MATAQPTALAQFPTRPAVGDAQVFVEPAAADDTDRREAWGGSETMSSALRPIEPGTMPPMSFWWGDVRNRAEHLSGGEHGAHQADVPLMGGPDDRVVGQPHVSVADGSATALDDVLEFRSSWPVMYCREGPK